MSRVGKQPVVIPSGVKVELKDRVLRAAGPNGTLEHEIPADITVKVDSAAGSIVVSRPTDSNRHKALHGLTQRLITNLVTGVSKGFEKKLSIVGIGYNARAQGTKVTLNIGFANQVEILAPDGIRIETPAPTQIVVKGADKQRVGQFAAEIRAIRPPEPYKGKGIRYENEYVRRKAGKAFVSGQ
jgi:large subunit ribosomal protein L6